MPSGETRISEPLALLSGPGGGPGGGGRVLPGGQRAAAGREGGAGGVADVEGVGLVPGDVGAGDVAGVEAAPPHQGAGQRQRQLGVVGRLAGQQVPGAAVHQLAHAVRVVLGDLLLALELDQAAERVAAELAEQRPLGPAQHGRVGAGPAGAGSPPGSVDLEAGRPARRRRESRRGQLGHRASPPAATAPMAGRAVRLVADLLAARR